MQDKDWLTARFDASRAHLRAVAYRMLGSASEAEDAVQEAWINLSRADTRTVENWGGWLTTVVARVCLDMLRTRRSRREEPLAPVVDRTPAAARRSLRGAAAPATDPARQRELVDAFLAASRDGNFERLVAVLSTNVVLRADDLALLTASANQRHGAPVLAPEVRGASLVADAFKGRARAALPALIDGEAGAVWVMAGQVRAAFVFTIERDKITGIDLIMDPGHLGELDVKID